MDRNSDLGLFEFKTVTLLWNFFEGTEFQFYKPINRSLEFSSYTNDSLKY